MAVVVSAVLDSDGKRRRLKRLPPSTTMTGSSTLMHFPGYGSNTQDSEYRRLMSFV
jgi:hypothetical protein